MASEVALQVSWVLDGIPDADNQLDHARVVRPAGMPRG